MKYVRLACVMLAIVSTVSAARAVECSGTVELDELSDLGCDGEATKVVSLAACDYRADKNPSISVFNVIDRVSGNGSVTVISTRPGSFTVRIAPASRSDDDHGNSCRVERFSWSAD